MRAVRHEAMSQRDEMFFCEVVSGNTAHSVLHQVFFPHESRNVTARLNTGLPGSVSSRSAMK